MLRQSAYLRKRIPVLLQFGIRGDVILHLTLMELLISHHVEVSRAGESEEDGLLLAGLLAFSGLVDGHPDGMGALGCGQDALHPGKVLRSLEDLRLFHTDGLHEPLMVEFRQGGAHAVVAQAPCVVGGGDEAAAKSVHFGQRADHAGVAEIIGVHAPGEAGAGGGLHGDEAVVGFPAQLLAHERRDEAA